MLNLDTHIVIDFLNEALSEKEMTLVRNQELAISDIVLWEIAKLKSLKRIEIDLTDKNFLAFLRSITIFPITSEIANQSIHLDFESDPADELIAATSIVENIELLTRDSRILKSKKTPLVRF